MEFTEEQKKAIDICSRRILQGERVTRLFGYAGTGKTTIAKEIAREVGGDVMFACYTGKAASVLTSKGCPASTIHSLFYRVVDKGSSAQPEFVFDKFKNQRRPKVLILDEVSQIDEAMAINIMSKGIPILSIGDPAQLPPVSGSEGYFTSGEPDAMLTEVIRNDIDILRIATDIRENGPRVIYRPEYKHIALESIRRSKTIEFDQVLTGRNITRWEKNKIARSLRGIDNDDIVAPGDKIQCTLNNHHYGMLNGQQFLVWEVDMGSVNRGVIQLLLSCDCNDKGSGSVCNVCGFEEDWIPVWMNGFQSPDSKLEQGRMSYRSRQRAIEATFGFAITVSKAQGSEWDRVIVVNESYKWRKDAGRWLYTAVTRAKKELVIIPNSASNTRKKAKREYVVDPD